MIDLLKFLDARLGEPSTYASLAVLLGVLHVNIDPGLMNSVSLWGAVLAGVLGVVLREFGNKPPLAIGADVLNTLVTDIRAMPEMPAQTVPASHLGARPWLSTEERNPTP